MADPWAFGWTQLFALAGLATTICIAYFGFRSFRRWKREKLEEKRIDVAIDALALAYESKFVFEHIRSPLVHSYEWSDMEKLSGESSESRDRRGVSYAKFKRIHQNKDFFENAWKLQPRCMAMFGPQVEVTFLKLHRARRTIEVAAEQLADKDAENVPQDRADLIEHYSQLRRDVNDFGNFQKEKDRVGKLLEEFVAKMERTCKPVIDKTFRGTKARRWWPWKHKSP